MVVLVVVLKVVAVPGVGMKIVGGRRIGRSSSWIDVKVVVVVKVVGVVVKVVVVPGVNAKLMVVLKVVGVPGVGV